LYTYIVRPSWHQVLIYAVMGLNLSESCRGSLPIGI
jgi:hypothetical protein